MDDNLTSYPDGTARPYTSGDIDKEKETTDHLLSCQTVSEVGAAMRRLHARPTLDMRRMDEHALDLSELLATARAAVSDYLTEADHYEKYLKDIITSQQFAISGLQEEIGILRDFLAQSQAHQKGE